LGRFRRLLYLSLGMSSSLVAQNDVRRDAVVEAVEKVVPTVVNIETDTIVKYRDPWESVFREFWEDYHRQQNQFSLGSGVVIDEAGYILTNEHVVRRADRIRVKFASNTNLVYEAKLVAFHGNSDLALIKIIARPGEKFRAVKFAPDDDLLLGETVLALGNPFGLGGSVSRGILSSKTRRAPKENDPLDIVNLLQTDASINPGNSGGPLVNLRGELIGINVAILKEAQGIGFAIPIRQVSDALSEIFTPEALKSLWFGARVQNGPRGSFIITSVQSGGPAERGGLKTGDLVNAVNGRTPRSVIEFNDLLIQNRDDVRLDILRQNERKTASVRLTPEVDFFNNSLIQQRTGLTLQEISAELAEQLRLLTSEGLIISSVEKNSPAAEVKLQRGMLVTAIDGKTPASLVEAAKIFHSRKKGQRVILDLIVQRRLGNFIQNSETRVPVTIR